MGTKGPGRKPLEPWQIEDAARLRALFAERAGMSQEKFGQTYAIGSQGAVWQYIEGRIPLNLAVALKFARGLHCDLHEISPTLEAELHGGSSRLNAPAFSRVQGQRVAEPENVYPSAGVRGRVPLISFVQAGTFAAAVDNFSPGQADEYVETTVPVRRHTYALRVRGDSMTNPAGVEPTFPDGSVIIVEPDAITTIELMVNQFVIFKRAAEDEATFKQLVKDGGKYYLKPLNPRFPLLELREGDVCCGVVREKPVRYF